jgi:FkbM family methyltransferase
MNKYDRHNQIRNLAAKASKTTREQKLAEYEAAYLRQTEGCERILLYGAGDYGREFMKFLQTIGAAANVECFLDRAADQKLEGIAGYPVYRADDERISKELREKALVIFTLIFEDSAYDDLKRYLQSLGYSQVIDDAPMIADLYLLLYSRENCLTASDTEDICRAFDLLSDEHSRDVFMSVFEAHALLKFHLPVLSPSATQYFDVDVPFRCHYRNFIDCGAYTGDTFEELVRFYKPEHYFGFEPDPNCYAKLVETLSVSEHQGHICSMPLGVSDGNTFLRFRSNLSSSKIDEAGDSLIQTVRLDDVLWNYDNLMIKMDIEGAEVAALDGAKRTITEAKPDLAICVYHRASDLWRIPLMLKDWVPEYRYYLLNHGVNTLETVLYCTI